ncbi:sigma-E factor negative regulatory protein [Xanthomonas maliensis]|uniref:sigma-E factor negative regulatory protein n=1 Tax=Xanthomonas maliensis TaxID=1321368 RepID=UPI00039A5F92|nr:sigma-E factor negative regulatory protein [Xanthomonas maliensis]KAB7762394.1 hypothetical protein CKY51_21415 [Xanthomonas maliensis]
MSQNPDMSTTDKFERHYRQQLSALMDGELNADESRFLLRRLAHDEELAGCHERWQLCGDVLRGAATAPAPLDFAARVRAAVAEAPAPQRAPRPAATAARWRWGGGAAIAASVAAIALFMARERLPDIAAPTPDAPVPVFATAARVPQPPQVAQVPQPPRAPADPDAVATLASAVPAAALASARRSATRQQQATRGVVATRQQAPARMLATAPASAPASAVAGATVAPFTHPETTLQSRPWPRALLSGAGDSPLNASFSGGSPTRAFYPFEPAAQPSAPAGSATVRPSPPPRE